MDPTVTSALIGAGSSILGVGTSATLPSFFLFFIKQIPTTNVVKITNNIIIIFLNLF